MERRNRAGQLPLVNHFLQHTLRSLCGEPLHWVYSIFWRILPRHYPPPVWENEAGPYDRSKGNKRNWILVWEDGYCDFVACSRVEAKECKEESVKPEDVTAEEEEEEEEEEGKDRKDDYNGPLQPELFFKMSHDVYNYGEGLMGKIAAEKSLKWIFRDPRENGNVPLLSAWQASNDSYPRTWEAQFKAGIQTIAIIAVGEGLLQLGSTKKVLQDADFVLMLQRKFSYLQSIPGVFAQTKISRPINADGDKMASPNLKLKQLSGFKRAAAQTDNKDDDEACSSYPIMPLNLPALPNVAVDLPSMYNSLQALLSKLPAVTPSVPMGDIGQEVVTAAHVNSQAVGASSKRVRSLTMNVIEGNSPVTGRLPAGGQSQTLTAEVWPDPHKSPLPQPLMLQQRPPSTFSSTNPALPNLADEFESYNSLFGQLIS